MIKNFLKTIKELNKTPRGKALLFFGGYFFFFLIIIIVFRTSSKVPLGKYSYEKGEKNNSSFEKIEKNNYTFTYNISIDGVNYQVTGEKNGRKEKFSYLGRDYLRILDNYFILDNGKWLKCDNPIGLSFFIEIDNINELIENAYFLAKTDYESGKIVKNYLISTNNIKKIKDGLNIDIADEAGEIVVSSDEEGDTNLIKLKLNSYCKYENICKEKLEIELNYDNFGEVLEINEAI